MPLRLSIRTLGSAALVGIAWMGLALHPIAQSGPAGQVSDRSSLDERVAALEKSQAQLLGQVEALQRQLDTLEALIRTLAPASRPRATAPLPSVPLSLVGAPTMGSRNATVAIVEFSDLQCPYCGEFARSVLPQLEKEYISTGRVLLGFRYFPLEDIHPQALLAAEAAECANQQGQFWGMHNSIFADQQALDVAGLTQRARTLGLDLGKFSACLKGSGSIRVKADQSTALRLGLNGTPEFLIGSVQPDGTIKVQNRLDGAKSLQAFKAVLDPLLGSAAKHAEKAPSSESAGDAGFTVK